MQDEDGQTIPSHSVSAGLDYPSVGPEHSWLADIGRAEYRAVDDAQAMEAFALLSMTEGIMPAIESAHALAGALQDRKSTRLNSSHVAISYAVFCSKKKNTRNPTVISTPAQSTDPPSTITSGT